VTGLGTTVPCAGNADMLKDITAANTPVQDAQLMNGGSYKGTFQDHVMTPKDVEEEICSRY